MQKQLINESLYTVLFTHAVYHRPDQVATLFHGFYYHIVEEKINDNKKFNVVQDVTQLVEFV